MPSPAPAMVQLLLIQSLQNTGRLPVVASSRQTFATDFLLLSNLRKFQVEKDASGTPQATVCQPALNIDPRSASKIDPLRGGLCR